MKGMAAADATDREPAPSHGSMFGHRLRGIFRASRVETAAMTYKGAERSLIEANQKNNQTFHGPMI